MFRIEYIKCLLLVQLTILVQFCPTSIYSYRSLLSVNKISVVQIYQKSALKLTAEKNENEKNEGITTDIKDRLFLYNTLSKDKQLFNAVDVDKKKVSFYRYNVEICRYPYTYIYIYIYICISI
jgi:hypothetical protein